MSFDIEIFLKTGRLKITNRTRAEIKVFKAKLTQHFKTYDKQY